MFGKELGTEIVTIVPQKDSPLSGDAAQEVARRLLLRATVVVSLAGNGHHVGRHVKCHSYVQRVG